MDDVAVLITENLHFYVARVADVAFHVERIVAEGRPRFSGGGAESRFDFVFVPDQLDAAATAAGRGLDQQRVTDCFRHAGRLVRVLRVIRPGDQREAGGAGDFSRLQLVAHHRDVLCAGTNEGDLVVGAGLRQLGPFGEKTVAGVERIAARAVGRGDQRGRFKITVGGTGRTDADGAIRKFGRKTLAVRLGHGGDGLNAQALAGSDDTNGDLAAIGDQNARAANENFTRKKGARLFFPS